MKTKTLMLLPLIVAAVACRDRYEGQAGAAASPSPTASPYAYNPPPTTASPYESPGTRLEAARVLAVVVSADAAGRTITLRETGAPTGEAGGD